MKAIIMKQKVCPSCDSLEMALMAAFKGKYEDKIVKVMKEDNELFDELKEKHGVTSTPTVLFFSEGDVLVDRIDGLKMPQVMNKFPKYLD